MGYLNQISKRFIRESLIETAFSPAFLKDSGGFNLPPLDDRGDGGRQEFLVAVMAIYGLKPKLDAALYKYQPGRKFTVDTSFFGDGLTEADLDLDEDELCGFVVELKLPIPRALNLRKDLRNIVKSDGSVDILTSGNDDNLLVLDPHGEWVSLDNNKSDYSLSDLGDDFDFGFDDED